MANTQLNFCCFRWNNYQSRITKAFEDLFYNEAFTDVTLACEGKSLKAHRVILSAYSSYFTELLKSTPCKHPVIVFQNIAFRDLHALVRFIYRGEVSVHQSSLSSFLKIAETLGISGFTQQADQTDNENVQFTGSNSDELLDHTSGFGNGLQTSDLADTSQKQKVGGFGGLQSAIKNDFQRQIQQLVDQTDRDEHVQFTGSNNDESLDRTSGFGNGLQTSDLADTSQKQEVGGFESLQSAIEIDYQRQIQQSPVNESNRYSEMIVQTQQELQGIEETLIDDISQMEFVKSEPVSPRLDPLADEHESCLSSNHTIKEVHTNFDSAHNQDCHRYNPRYNQLLQPTSRKSLNDELELRWLQLSNITSLIVVHKEQDQSLSSTYCQLCQKNYTTVAHLRRHFADCHLYKPKALICDQCGKSFKSKHSLYCHRRSYHVHNRRGKNKNKY